MNRRDEFEKQKRARIQAQGEDRALYDLSLDWMLRTLKYSYSLNFNWLGVPIVQLPPDILVLQELVWAIRPDLVVETGIARGGSLVFYASLLELLGGNGQVLGIDLDIRPHTREAIAQHPLKKRISMIEGSSVDPGVVTEVFHRAEGRERVLVILDSDHAHGHVLEELCCYSPLVSEGSYLVVCDTSVDEIPPGFYTNRSWGPGNSPKSAVRAFLKECDRFVIDREIDYKLLISANREGYLRCVKEGHPRGK